MIHNFFTAHRFLAYTGVGGFFALSGYGFARVSPDDPLMAISSWIFALFYFAFALATTGSEGAVLGFAALVAGVIWMARYYERHRSG